MKELLERFDFSEIVTDTFSRHKGHIHRREIPDGMIRAYFCRENRRNIVRHGNYGSVRNLYSVMNINRIESSFAGVQEPSYKLSSSGSF